MFQVQHHAFFSCQFMTLTVLWSDQFFDHPKNIGHFLRYQILLIKRNFFAFLSRSDFGINFSNLF